MSILLLRDNYNLFIFKLIPDLGVSKSQRKTATLFIGSRENMESSGLTYKLGSVLPDQSYPIQLTSLSSNSSSETTREKNTYMN
jgi:hypothetical protein